VEARGVTLQIPGDKCYHGDKPCGCAIGTALYSAGVRTVPTCNRFELLASVFPVALKLPLCPVCDGHGYHFGDDPKTPGSAVECLFENHKWTRKAISEWVEVIENAQERASKPAIERSETQTTPESSDVATTRQIESVVLT
jgi:hypothetical protein